MAVQTPTDVLALTEIWEELTALSVSGATTEAALDRTVELARAAILECELASITVNRDGIFETAAFTESAALMLDEVQYDADVGPALYSFRRREPAAVPCMAEGSSWPAFRIAATAHGVRSALSLPLVTSGFRAGTLNLYARADNAFESEPGVTAVSFARLAAAAIRVGRALEETRRVAQRLEHALESRDVIGMAKGVIIAREMLTSDDAFTRLADAAQRRSVPVRTVAQEVLATGVVPA